MKRNIILVIILAAYMLSPLPAAVLPVRADTGIPTGNMADAAVSSVSAADDHDRIGGTGEKNGVRIAFIDSGISTKHIDCSRVLQGTNYIFPESDTQDRIGHGTATAGLVLGAEDQGVTGICPDAFAVPLVVIDAYPSGTVKNGGSNALCEAIYDAVDCYKCRIINISLCTTEDSEELRTAVAYAEKHDVMLIAAVGNDGENGRSYYPAAYETVVAVGSADGRSVAPFSQNGADVLADGVDLLTATNRNGAAPASVSGTSYSCALVTGICARLIASAPGLSPLAVREALYAQAEDLLEPGIDSRSGRGVILVSQDDLSMYPIVSPQSNRGRRYTTIPGECYQTDWGVRKCRDDYRSNIKDCMLIHAFMRLGVPHTILTDSMKSIVIHRDSEGHPIWQKDYELFL